MLKPSLRINALSDVNTINGRVESVEGVKRGVKRFFKDKFVKISWYIHALDA